MDLYGLNKDMLVKMITTIQDDRKPEKMGDYDLETAIFEYANEMFKRKSKCIKEYLISKEIYSKEIIDNITIFKLLRGMLFLRTESMYFVIHAYPYLNIAVFDLKSTLFYSFKKGIQGIIPSIENISPDFDYQTYSKYIDFVKLLDENKLIIKIMNYLEIFSKEKLE